MQQEEHYKECSADSLDELSPDGVVECVRH